MKIFKTIDDKFADIGFEKIDETDCRVSYERSFEGADYKQYLDLIYAKNGRHLIESYDLSLMDKKEIGYVGLGLTMHEAMLCVRKMKQKGWKVNDGKFPPIRWGR